MNNHVTDEMIQDSINRMNLDFDSHAVIRDLMIHYPRAYVTELFGYVASGDPITVCHATLGKRLATFDTINKTQTTKSPNIRGQNTENMGWRKRD